MKITHIDGNVTDTARMLDADAEALETAQKFLEYCCSHGVPFVLFVEMPVSKKHTQMHNFDPKREGKADGMFIGRLISAMRRWLKRTFNGFVTLRVKKF